MQQIDTSRIPHTLTTVEGQPAIWLGGATCVRHEAVDEASNREQVGRVFAHALHGRGDAPLPAWLIPEPQNPHDANAIMIWLMGGRVGYLARDLARQWHSILTRLRANNDGRHVACNVSLDPPSPANQGGFGIIVWLPPLPISAPAKAAPRVPAPPAIAQNRPGLLAVISGALTRVGPTETLSPEHLESLRGEISHTNALLNRAKLELEAVEESIEIQSFGFYQPKYGFESSAHYAMRLEGIKKEQQTLLKDDNAAVCETNWTVGGSAAEGKKMVKHQAKLMLRAFNGECDAAIAKVRYDNVTKLELRLSKAYESINKLGQVQQVTISRRYFDLKLAELHLVHEHREKVQAEKEEQKRIREQMREEQKVQDELERAKADAEKDEQKSAAALEKARADLDAAAATTKQHERLEGLVNKLESELKEALERKAKAIARAQLTRSGHVYVLSNIGSFGENIFKIGLTRRLDPFERVEELGDASVPFPFDVHAIIYAEDAPGLESRLHKAFASRRVNAVNQRKEYFRVTLAEIQEQVKLAHGLVTFQLKAEAAEYHKSQAASAGVPTLAESGVVAVAARAKSA